MISLSIESYDSEVQAVLACLETLPLDLRAKLLAIRRTEKWLAAAYDLSAESQDCVSIRLTHPVQVAS